MTLLFFDTETSGLHDFKLPVNHPAQPHLVQMALLLTDDTGEIKGEVNTLIRAERWDIEETAERVHGISKGATFNFGLSVSMAAKIFASYATLADKIVCHNIEYDKRVMQTTFFRLGLPDYTERAEWFCTMLAYTPILKLPKKYPTDTDPYKWPRLEEVYTYLFHEPLTGAHDAMADIRATMKIYFKLQEGKENDS